MASGESSSSVEGGLKPSMVFPMPTDGVFKNRFVEVELGGRSVLELSDAEFEEKVAGRVWRHGVICVKNQDLTPAEMKQVSARIGEPVLLPPAFSFDNRDPEHLEIVRVGNMKVDGSIKPGVRAAEYWHSDGNFWGKPGYQIVNCLHAKVIPDTGGNTGFMDTTLALNSGLFDEKTKERLRRSTCLVSCRWISDFKDAKPEEMLPDVAMPCVSLHPKTGEETLYVPFTPKGLYDEVEKVHWMLNDDIWQKICAAGFTYEHKYEAGDLLLWDNVSLHHRSMGGYGNHPRLLFRAQARYDAPGQISKL